MPHAGGHLSSLIQIPKFSERPSIVPNEVSDEPLRFINGLFSSKMKNLFIP